MSALCHTRPTFLDAWQSPQTFRAVSRMLGHPPVQLELERTHFPGKRPVQLALRAVMPDGRGFSVLGEHCPDDAPKHFDRTRASLSKSRNGQKPGLYDHAIQIVEGAGLILRRPGLDERLPGLRMLYDSTFARDIFQDLFGQDCGGIDVELVAHRLGKRAVLRLKSSETVIYARLRAIKSNDGQDRLALHRTLWNSLAGQSALHIPEPLGANPDIGASFFGPLPGASPHFRDADSDATARAIAVLQALKPDRLPVHTGADEAQILSDWLQRCQHWRPEFARKIAQPVARVSVSLKSTNKPARPCHRDLHEKQILVAGGVAGLLDFDTLCLSDPALDPGNLLAHLFFAGVNEAPLRSRLDQPGIGLWRSAALLRLAMIYAFTSTPTPTLGRLIKEACPDVQD